jgi:hypothetical protein
MVHKIFLNPMVYYVQNFELRNLRYEFSKITRFLLFPSISKITGNISENIPLTGQRSTAGQRTIWTVRGIQRIRATWRFSPTFPKTASVAFRRVAVAALRRLPRPVVVAARLVERRRSSWRSPRRLPLLLAAAVCSSRAQQWWRRGRTLVRDSVSLTA